MVNDNNNILDKIEENGKLSKEEQAVASLTGDFIFGIVMGSKEVCISFLNLVLSTKVKVKKLKRKLVDDKLIETEVKTNDDIYNVISQKVIENNIGMKSVRLDILAEIDNTLYNIEMQCKLNDNFAKRTRFYQGMIDVKLLPIGEEIKYNEIPNTYIIFITKTDYFGLEYPIYTFTPRCYENPNLEMNDGTVKIFINLSSKRNKFEKLGLLTKRIEEVKTKAGKNQYVEEQRKFNRTKEFYEKMYDLIDVFNGKTKFSKELDEDIKNIIGALEKARKDERVIEMTTAMSQWAEELKLYGEQRGIHIGFQQGELKKTISAISNGLKDDVMPNILSNILSVSHDFVYYVRDYFKANSDKTDEENVNALVEKVMSGEVSTK